MLDDLMPNFHFAEKHHRRIHASAAATWAALTRVTLNNLTITRPLVALRHLKGASGGDQPLLTNGPLSLLHREDGRLAIAGAIAQPWKLNAPRRTPATLAQFSDFDEPGWTKYLTEFRIVPDSSNDHCLLTTETRGLSTDEHARRRFRLYWAMIRVPSGLIRRDILQTVARTTQPAP